MCFVLLSDIPTGFNVESVTFKNVVFNVWDVGGQHKLRALWKHYYKGSAPEIRRANARAFIYSFDNVLTTCFLFLF